MKLKDKLLITGSFVAGSLGFFSGCSENKNIPAYEMPETIITDNYKSDRSNSLAKQIDEDLKWIETYKNNVKNPADRLEWKGYVQESSAQIDKSNSMMIRSYFEHKNYMDNYDKSDEKVRNFLDNRVHNLFYNKNISFTKILEAVDIDAFAQIIKQGDSLSILDYNEQDKKLLEYRIKFGEGAEFEDYDGKFQLNDRQILIETYEHSGKTLTEKIAPTLINKETKHIDIVHNQTSLRELIYNK